MNSYRAPLQDITFVLKELGVFKRITELPEHKEVSAELVNTILEAAGKFAVDVLAPLNQPGDRQGCLLTDSGVQTPDGFAEAYRTFADNGWTGLSGSELYGGQGLPTLISIAVKEILISANMAWSLCPSLSQGAIELLSTHGTDKQKETFLPNLITGKWTGTMNLTEEQSGSDLAHLRCQAIREGDQFRIKGQKIFITWGEHDMAENIIHLVLARTQNAPEGNKGISLFLVPKLLFDTSTQTSVPNDVSCISLEHKLGIRASPTCVISYGREEGALGALIGEENHGLDCMFTMMNFERLSVGLQGMAIAERAYQQARNFSLERIQGRNKSKGSGQNSIAIINHPDVRRMLLTIRSQIEAMRAVIYDTAALMDVAKCHPEESVRSAALGRVDLLTPVVKGWCTDLGTDLTSLALQIHGGVGYIEETGMAQHFRDARIAPIYEGTNGIQANDLLGRKIIRDNGREAKLFIDDVRAQATQLENDVDSAVIRHHLNSAVNALEIATDWLIQSSRADHSYSYAGATYYMRLLGQIAGGSMMAKAYLAAQLNERKQKNTGIFHAKKIMARFYAEHILSQTPSLLIPITEGHKSVLELPNEEF